MTILELPSNVRNDKATDYLEAIEGKLRYRVLMKAEKDLKKKAEYKRLFRRCVNIIRMAKEKKK